MAPETYPSGSTTQEHPEATTILILGILGMVCCGIVAPFAWIKGNKARDEVSRGQYRDSTLLTVGWVLGIVGTIFLVLNLLTWPFLFIF